MGYPAERCANAVKQSGRTGEALQNLRTLRWVTIVVPAIAVLASDVLTAVLSSHLGEWFAHGFFGGLLILLIVPFSLLVFRLFTRTYAAVTEQNDALIASQARTAQQARQLRALDEAGLALVSDLSIPAVLQQVVDRSRELVRATSARLQIADETTANVGPVHSVSAPGMELEADYRGALRIPIVYKDRPIGDLLVSGKEDGEFTVEDRRLLNLFAAHAAVAIERARLQAELAAYAVMEERARIAREMHDGFAQVLGYVSAKTQAAEEFAASGQHGDVLTQLRELRGAVGDLYTDVREAIFDLRDVHTTGRGLDGDLAAYVRQFAESSGVDTRFERTLEPLALRCEPIVEAHLMRIVQEALTNVRKHAQASHAWVRIAGTDCGQLEVTVRDDGIGFETAGDHPEDTRFGLRVMRERAELIGAALTIDSAPGDGTRIVLRLPLSKVPDAYSRR